jgi:hypothetical protein
MRISSKASDLYIYTMAIRGTYWSFIYGNLKLISDLIKEKEHYERWETMPSLKEPIIKARVKHLQIMSLLGLTAEHILKAILLKRGYVINRTEPNKELEYSEKFMKELGGAVHISQTKLDSLYREAESEILSRAKYSDELLKYEVCKKIFDRNTEDGYFKDIGKLKISGDPYLGEFTEITPQTCFDIIQKFRNRYLHRADACFEIQGIVWYVYNFLLWVTKKESPLKFEDLEYVGGDDVKELFP